VVLCIPRQKVFEIFVTIDITDLEAWRVLFLNPEYIYIPGIQEFIQIMLANYVFVTRIFYNYFVHYGKMIFFDCLFP